MNKELIKTIKELTKSMGLILIVGSLVVGFVFLHDKIPKVVEYGLIGFVICLIIITVLLCYGGYKIERENEGRRFV